MVFYIVTPAFNSQDFIEQCVTSVVTQAGDFYIHYHVQDGGSTDGTLTILRKWDDLLRSPNAFCQCRGVSFSWASERDSGMYDAINKGFSRLQVPDEGIMAWLNSDDTYFPHVFSSVLNAFHADGHTQWISGAVCLLSSDGALVPRGKGHCYYPREVIAGGCCEDEYWHVVQQNGCFWNGRLWKEAGPLNEALRYAGDYDLWKRFAQHAEMRYYDVLMGTFRIRQGQLSAGEQYKEEVERVTSRGLRQAASTAFAFRNPFLPSVPAIVYDFAHGKLTSASTRPCLTMLFFYSPWQYFRLVGGVVKRAILKVFKF